MLQLIKMHSVHAAEGCTLEKVGLSLGFLLMVVLWECYSIMVVPEFWRGRDMLVVDAGPDS